MSNSAQLEGVFDPSQIAPTMGGGNALPVSDKNGHLVVITESEIKQTNSGTGTMLALTLQIQDGPHAGSEGNWNLNIGNPNATTVRIAQQELACICHAVEYLQALQDISVLHNKPFRVVVELQKSQEAQEKGYTEVKKVLRSDGSKLTDPKGSGGQAAPSPSPAPAPAQAPPQQAPATAQSGFPVQTSVQPAQPAQAPPATAQPPQTAPQQPPQQGWQQPQPAQAPPQQPAAPSQPVQGGVPWGQPPAQ